MTSTKINLLLLPLLVSILLSTAGKLKIGKTLDNVFYTILTPIHMPVGYLRQVADTQISFISSLPKLKQQNKDLIFQNSRLLSENEQLKQSIVDSKTAILTQNFKSVLPVRLTGSIGNNSVSSSLPLDKVKKGQPLIFGKILVIISRFFPYILPLVKKGSINLFLTLPKLPTFPVSHRSPLVTTFLPNQENSFREILLSVR